ncbi:MAG: Mov34/MPN/PAD-1 family protein, partial [Candidatus Lokiarchaeota archaeon]|nr:Mov34/MPN/PAD-1 family protein [Candidatus Lokiarchaeota archaeon]
VYALRYANNDMKPKNWREAYGILIGHIENDDICYITDAIPMIVGSRAGVKFETKQYADMAQIDESLYEKFLNEQSDDFILGWWHTHPGFGWFFSRVDTATQLGYQGPNPYAIGLIYDHTEQTINVYGIKGLRLVDSSRGVYSKYAFAELKFDVPVDQAIKKINNEIKEVLPKFKEINELLHYIHNVLRKRLMAQLQRNFGLILVPKRDKKITTSEELAEEEADRYLYEWNPKFLEEKYRVPHYREKLEKEIAKSKQKLKKILKNKTYNKSEAKKKFEGAKKKIQGELEKKLLKPKEWLGKIKARFNKKMEVIRPYYDYLDTAERKIVEYLEERLNSYTKELKIIEEKLKFKIK